MDTLAGMYIFHHKTKHWYFVTGMPLILVLQAVVGLWVRSRMSPMQRGWRWCGEMEGKDEEKDACRRGGTVAGTGCSSSDLSIWEE
ncbi:MAG: hypothetical protein IJ682_10220 [Lachnospiraceae bacterium]|nr:hypothetical protein [Lachnospiraceae bacterium]